jgi:hypothetical protein
MHRFNIIEAILFFEATGKGKKVNTVKEKKVNIAVRERLYLKNKG